MKVARIIARLNVGGPAQHVVWLTGGLSSFGMDTALITGNVPAGEQDMAYFAAEHGVRPQIIREMSRELSWRDGVVALRLFRLLLRERPDLVHTHTAKAGAVGRTAAIAYNVVARFSAKRRRVAIIHTYHGHVFHGYYSPWRTRFFLAIERVLARFTDRILVLSERQRFEIQEQFGIGRPAQFRIVPLGVEIATLTDARIDRTTARTALSLPPDARVVAIVGRVTAVKNHELFLRAVAQLAVDDDDSSKTICALVVGDGDARPAAERLSETLGLDQTARFIGVQTSMAPVYSALDILVVTSRNEGTPLAIIEAMVCGRPVVATAVGGIPDLLGDPVNAAGPNIDGVSVCERGVLVTRADAACVADAIRLLFDQPDICHRIVTAAQRYAEETFSVDRLVRDVAQIYQAVVDVPDPAVRSTA